jgi:hypothetical protein
VDERADGRADGWADGRTDVGAVGAREDVGRERRKGYC